MSSMTLTAIITSKPSTSSVNLPRCLPSSRSSPPLVGGGGFSTTQLMCSMSIGHVTLFSLLPPPPLTHIAYPTTCGEFKIRYVRDLVSGLDTSQPNNKVGEGIMQRRPMKLSCIFLTYHFTLMFPDVFIITDGIYRYYLYFSGESIIRHPRTYQAVQQFENNFLAFLLLILQATLPLSSTPMVTFTFENGTVATLRGSGTEPKLKYYGGISFFKIWGFSFSNPFCVTLDTRKE